MGHPKKFRKKYTTPSHPFQADRIKEENKLLEGYGLKNKKELWKIKSKISNYRGQARSLLGRQTEHKKKRTQELLTKLHKSGVLKEGASLDDVLSLSIEDLLERRLETLVYKKGLAVTQKQARQFIVHGNIAINGRKITSPGKIVLVSEEATIAYYGKAPELKYSKMTDASTKDDINELLKDEPKKEKVVEKKVAEVEEADN